MKTNVIKCVVAALWCIALPLAPLANAQDIQARSVDVALQQGGLLSGQVVNAEGQPLAGETVVVKSGGNEVARVTTDKQGQFRAASLKGGVVEVDAVGVAGNCRLWAPGTAPPAAQQGLLVVAKGDAIRGQHCCDSVGCGSVVGGRGARGHGGLFGLMVDHPLVTAGAIGAAIAIPIAVSNDKSPSSP